MKQFELLKKPKGFIVLFLLLALPITLYMTKQVQDLRQRAQQSVPRPPVFGKAVSFSGNQSYLKYNNTANLRGPFQVEAWIKPEFDSNRINDAYSLLSFVPESISKDCIDTLDLRTQNYANNYTVDVGISQNGEGGSGIINVGMGLPYNQWAHVAVTVSDTEMSYFINGEKAATQTIKSPFCGSPTIILVGAYNPYLNQGLYHHYKGAIDEIRIQNKITYTANFKVPNSPRASDTSSVVFHLDGKSKDETGMFDLVLAGNVKYIDSTVGELRDMTPTPKLSIYPTIAPQFSCDIDKNQVTNERDFTYYYHCMRNAIQCSPDIKSRADLNKDGYVETGDLYRYTRSCVSLLNQNPTGSLTPTPIIINDPLSPTPSRISVTPPKATFTPPPASPTLTVGSIYGSVYLDSNRNSSKDSTEKPVTSGWISVYLQNRLVRVATVSSNGSFSIKGLSPNTYGVRLFPTIGYTVSTANPVTLKLDNTKVHTVQFGVYTR